MGSRRRFSLLPLVALVALTLLVIATWALVVPNQLQKMLRAPLTEISTRALASSEPAAPATPIPPLDSSGLPDWVSVAKNVGPSTVSILVRTSNGGGEGSGIVLDDAGHILTNHHVAAGAGGQLQVSTNDGMTYAAKLVGSDVDTDVAVIQVESAKGLRPAMLGDSDALKVGEAVMAIGAPLGLQNTVTTGIVSALHRPVITQQESTSSFQSEAKFSATSAIQTDASINPGNSGGALVDARGGFIGVYSSIASMGSSSGRTSGSIGLGFAIPIKTAKTIADQIIRDGSAKKPVMGVEVRDGAARVNDGQMAGAEVMRVTPDSPAAKGGISAGDVIVAVDGAPTNSSKAVIAFIRSQPIGSEHTVTVARNGNREDVKVRLDRAS